MRRKPPVPCCGIIATLNYSFHTATVWDAFCILILRGAANAGRYEGATAEKAVPSPRVAAPSYELVVCCNDGLRMITPKKSDVHAAEPQRPATRNLGQSDSNARIQAPVDCPPIVRCPGCNQPLLEQERKPVLPITTRLVDVRYVCPTCQMETTRTVTE